MVHDELGVVEDTRITPWLEGCRLGSPSWSVASSQRCRCCSPCRRPGGGRMVSQRSPPSCWERSKLAIPARVRCGPVSNFSPLSLPGPWPGWDLACCCTEDECWCYI